MRNKLYINTIYKLVLIFFPTKMRWKQFCFAILYFYWEEIENLLSDIPTHPHEEFAFLGEIYHRSEIVHLAPYKGLSVSSDVRDESEIEVNHID